MRTTQAPRRLVRRLVMVLAVVSGLSIWMLAIPTTSAASGTSQDNASRERADRLPAVAQRQPYEGRHLHDQPRRHRFVPGYAHAERRKHRTQPFSRRPLDRLHGDPRWGSRSRRLFKIRPDGSGKTELEQTCTRRLSGRRVPRLVEHRPDRLPSNPVSLADGSDRIPRDLRDASRWDASPSDHATRAEPSHRVTLRRRVTGLVPEREATGVRAVRQLERPPGDLHRFAERHGAPSGHPMAARRFTTAVLAARSMDRVPLR